jgi:hypothetical protein
MDKWNFLRKPKSKLDSHFGARRNLGPKRGGKQGELARTCMLKVHPKGLVGSGGQREKSWPCSRIIIA